MKLDNNQLFYATLYWAEALPGGAAFSDDICAEHKPYMPMDPPLQTADKIEVDPYKDYGYFPDTEENIRKNITSIVESGVSREQFNAFFEAMYRFLTDGGERKRSAGSPKDGKYIELSRCNPHSDRDVPFSNAIIYGLQAAGLHSEILNPQAEAYVHDNGQLIVMPRTGKGYRDFIDVAYPGRPVTGRSLPGIAVEDSAEATSLVSIEYLYRAVPLEAGKTCVIRYGEDEAYDFTAKEGDVFYISHHDVGGDLNLLRQMADEEIISGQNPVLRGGMHLPANDKEEYQPGYADKKGSYSMEATDDPRIVRMLQAPARCMEVTARVQISYGRNFQVAEPGDKILFDEKQRRILVIRKEDIENGACRLVAQGKIPDARRGVKFKPTPE
jgi:hypothetical protein